MDHQHATVPLGFAIKDEARKPVTIRGKRRWYAPWLRHPDRVFDAVEQLEQYQVASRDALSQAMARRLFG